MNVANLLAITGDTISATDCAAGNYVLSAQVYGNGNVQFRISDLGGHSMTIVVRENIAQQFFDALAARIGVS